ncbi:MAG: DUF6616 family protein [Caulobacteraceae bacterium]
MSHLFIELYKYKPAWLALPPAEREKVRSAVLEALTGLQAAGLEIIGWGANDPATDLRADHDFFCVYRTPSPEFTRQFESGIRASGWHELFDQVALSGPALSPAEVLALNVSYSA